MIKLALSHDIDRTTKSYQFITKPIRALLKGEFNTFLQLMSTSLRKGNYWTFDDIIEIENSFNVKSTFFFLNESIRFNILNPISFVLSNGRYNILNPQIVDLIKNLDINGWEIGVHGSYNSYKSLELLKKGKVTLEEILGHPVDGIRQHYLNLDDDTWKKQFDTGFKYDSSYGYTRAIGFKENKYSPFYPLNNNFVVFLLLLMMFALWQKAIGGISLNN